MANKKIRSWLWISVAGLAAFALAIYFAQIAPYLAPPLPHPQGYETDDTGSRRCNAVLWDLALLDRGEKTERRELEYDWVNRYRITHGNNLSYDQFTEKLGDWCRSHPKNTMGDAVIYVSAAEN